MKATLIFLLCLVFCLTKCQDPENFRDNEYNLLSRQKRGVGSILVKLTSFLFWTTNSGITIAEIAAGGCSSYPSICRDRDAIELIDDEIKLKKTKFDELFLKNGRSYVDLKNGATNNQYLSLYMNRTINALDRLKELTNLFLEKSTTQDFDSYSQEAQNNGLVATSAKYMDDIVGQLEASLYSVKQMTSQDSDNKLMGTAVQMFVESLLNRFMRSFSGVYGSNKGDSFYSSYIQNMFNAGGVGNQNKVNFLQNMNLVSEVFKRIGTRLNKYLQNGSQTLKYWNNVNSWYEVKSKYVHTIQDRIQQIDFERNFNSLHHEKEVKGIPWAKIITGVLRTIGRAIKIAIHVKNWQGVASEMANARQKYEEYNYKLSQEIKVQGDLKNTLDKGWENTVRVYKRRIESFRSLLVELTDKNDFNGLFGLTKQLTDTMSNYMPPNLNHIDTQNLVSNQDRTIGYLQNIYNGFIDIQKDLDVRIIMYNSVREYVGEGKSVSYMLQSLQNIYKYRTDQEKIFGASLVENDIVCTIATMFPLKTEYDFITLEPYRPSCDVSTTPVREQKEQERSLMVTVVKTTIKQDSATTLRVLYNSVRNAYLYSSNAKLRTFGSSISEKDVVCVVATEFPTKQTFDFIPLASFRPSCTDVSEADFSVLKQKKLITEIVKTAMDTCDSYSHCPCIANISNLIRQKIGVVVTENDLKEDIGRLKPGLVKYCGTTGCSCVDLP